MAFPELGILAPNFSLLNQHNELVELKQFRNKKNVLIYFYPKAATPGCTVQACGIRDYLAEIAACDTVVLAISPDKPEKLKKFDEKYSLDFFLLSDLDHAVAEAYGAWGQKKFMGRDYLGVIRSSFLVDLNGKLLHIMNKVNTKTHNLEIILHMKQHF